MPTWAFEALLAWKHNFLTLFTTLHNLLPLGFPDFAVTLSHLANSSFKENHFSNFYPDKTVQLATPPRIFPAQSRKLLPFTKRSSLFSSTSDAADDDHFPLSIRCCSLQNNYNHHFGYCLRFSQFANFSHRKSLSAANFHFRSRDESFPVGFALFSEGFGPNLLHHFGKNFS